MKGISTVGILILTVFLSISVLPACADFAPVPGHPVLVSGYAESDGEPVDNATVTICDVNDASKCITVQVGESYGEDTLGCWKANIASIVGYGETVRVTITANDGSIVEAGTYIVDAFSPGGMVPPPPASGGIDTTSSSGSGGGTYPPGWGTTPTPAPTPDATATAAASTETTEPSVTTPAEDEAVTPAAEDEATAEETEPTTELKTPGFGAVFMIAGLLAAVYLVLRRRE
ncbi:MAG: PGF-CTERM sorting domain-containing protein [Methanosarcinales archaeon]|nr:PGF-CTERM sorting domain-containing protein [Methanosarcinales archaeon]